MAKLSFAPSGSIRHEPLDPVRADGGGREWRQGDGDDEVVVLKQAELVPLEDGRVWVVGALSDRRRRVVRNVLATRIFDPVRNDWLVGADLPAR